MGSLLSNLVSKSGLKAFFTRVFPVVPCVKAILIVAHTAFELKCSSHPLAPCQGCSLDALAELEQHMLASFGVASFQELQLPGACTSLLSLLVQNEAFIATLTGWDAPSDVGCVPFDEVQGLVRQVLGNLCGDGSGKAVHKDHEALHGGLVCNTMDASSCRWLNVWQALSASLGLCCKFKALLPVCGGGMTSWWRDLLCKQKERFVLSSANQMFKPVREAEFLLA